MKTYLEPEAVVLMQKAAKPQAKTGTEKEDEGNTINQQLRTMK